jgi:hypothetical protein
MDAKGPRTGWWLVVKAPSKDPGGEPVQIMGLNDQALETLPWDDRCHRTKSFPCGDLTMELHEVSIPKLKGWHLQVVRAFYKVVGRKSTLD